MAIDDVPRLARHRDGDTEVFALQGRWRVAEGAELGAAVAGLQPVAAGAWRLDGAGLLDLDTTGAFMLLARLRALGVDIATLPLVDVQDRHRKLLTLVCENIVAAAPATPPRHDHLLPRIGKATLHLGHTFAAHIAFLGEITLEALSLLRRPRLFRGKEAAAQFQSVTVDALPIVVLVTLLIGVVFAYLLGVQAQRYGAAIFVVDGVGIAICRELSPILVAVVIAGRSGAAFTAQIGSMKVQEETDAIRTLGLSPIQVLVFPRLAAIVIGLPLLVFMGDAAGVAGGILVGAWQLDIAPAAFLNRLHSVLPMSALVIGLAKAPVFAAVIALIACRMGLSVERDARSVGEHTTSTVVQSIVWVIVLDAVFAVLLQKLGI